MIQISCQRESDETLSYGPTRYPHLTLAVGRTLTTKQTKGFFKSWYTQILHYRNLKGFLPKKSSHSDEQQEVP